jgi:hypothetical protein
MSGKQIKKLRNWKNEKCKRVGKIIDSKLIFGIMKDGRGRLAKTLLYQKIW